MGSFGFSIAMQVLVVVTPDWDAIEGKLYRYQRASLFDSWKLIVDPIDVSVGKKGMAWGRGLHEERDLPQRLKREGDQKAPAGIFSLGSVFGDAAHQHFADKMPFMLIDEDLECVDDADSRYYNRFVHRQEIMDCDWKSSEKMDRVGFQYALGIVIQHNTDPVEAGMGSAIFMHIWRENKQGTAGCTAMQEVDLNEIVSWLDIKMNPCVIQMPIEEYTKMQRTWHLPTLPEFACNH
jgi:L,D-peptidoglycan transpeptidase YkuD (ErfK/YbiS/YcfS/YnhG family)